MKKKLLIAIPAYNEEIGIKDIILKCKKISDVIVVNDGSKDKTGYLAKKYGAKVINHKTNYGYDEAISSAVKFFLKSNYSKIIFIDADGDHPITEIKRFNNYLNNYDLVCGVRKNIFRLGERFFVFFSYLRWRLKDPLCGMKAYNHYFLKKVYTKMKFKSIHTEYLIKASKRKFKIKQVNINNKPRIFNARFGSGFSTNLYIIFTFFKCLFLVNTK